MININLYDSRSLSRFNKKLVIELDEDMIETHVREDESREETTVSSQLTYNRFVYGIYEVTQESGSGP